ncbi:DUF4348 domain-containing protein [Aquiflexum sp. TKW24L]|uniref:DUF4348 domain-containing protein n=1 Tax=Aquiflexum sp. TKW24L TaxID=2942212 RepID=UPI0020C08F63|nr:DUF4348 domain-containing protein [Aquiflexum sp. TKW24L]MCL6258435.1 DUF4348 domain-containing protein [Aquiflexum sp. TKW24L]
MKFHSVQSLAFIAIFFAILSISDAFAQGKLKTMVKIQGTPPEEFPIFYERFHSDSAFQMSRIMFPLEGLRQYGMEEIPWTADNWELMRTRIYQVDTLQFKTKVKHKKKYFEQTLWIEGTNFSSMRRFELLGNRWFLVYAYEGSL